VTCSAEFPCYSTIANAVDRVVRESTIPSPPSEDDGGVLPTLTLTDVLATIAVLKEQREDHLHTIRVLEQRIANLEAELCSRGSERR
jgi:hypothetical protein